MVELFKIALYYSVEKKLDECIDQSIQQSKKEGLID